MVKLVKDVIAAEGVGAVHGLFCRGGHAPYFIEVLNRDEIARISEGVQVNARAEARTNKARKERKE